MDEERDYVVFTDDEGNEFELDVITYFDFKDNEYAILADCNCGCEECDDECDEDEGLYIMKIVTSEDGQTEEFVPPAEEDMDELIALAEEILSEDCCCDECDCEDCDHDDCNGEDGECTCGCHDKK
ncbi:MAG: DUF1292 domain-containing protein [Clostridiales bacterium]|nr:DUF1292 domain-containing protein [Clostridiales bacterium]